MGSAAATTQRPGMISPASGIHRPSYNGAPARQTLLKLCPLLLRFREASFLYGLRFNVRRRIAGIAQSALLIKPFMNFSKFTQRPLRPLHDQVRRVRDLRALHAADAILR